MRRFPARHLPVPRRALRVACGVPRLPESEIPASRRCPTRRRRAGRHVNADPLAFALILARPPTHLRVDSIPAIFAITADPFLVFNEQRLRHNSRAAVGFYFALAEMISMFRYLKGFLWRLVLALVGGKMLLAPWLKEISGDLQPLPAGTGAPCAGRRRGRVPFRERPSADRHGAGSASAGGTDTPR